jgi:hypothetical protein
MRTHAADCRDRICGRKRNFQARAGDRTVISLWHHRRAVISRVAPARKCAAMGSKPHAGGFTRVGRFCRSTPRHLPC